jgi:hypothetical protein
LTGSSLSLVVGPLLAAGEALQEELAFAFRELVIEERWDFPQGDGPEAGAAAAGVEGESVGEEDLDFSPLAHVGSPGGFEVHSHVVHGLAAVGAAHDGRLRRVGARAHRGGQVVGLAAFEGLSAGEAGVSVFVGAGVGVSAHGGLLEEDGSGNWRVAAPPVGGINAPPLPGAAEVDGGTV